MTDRPPLDIVLAPTRQQARWYCADLPPSTVVIVTSNNDVERLFGLRPVPGDRTWDAGDWCSVRFPHEAVAVLRRGGFPDPYRLADGERIPPRSPSAPIPGVPT